MDDGEVCSRLLSTSFARGPEIRITATAVACSPVNPDDNANIVSSVVYCSSDSLLVPSLGSWTALVADEYNVIGGFGRIVDFVVVFPLNGDDNDDVGDKNRGLFRLAGRLDAVRILRRLPMAPQRSANCRLENPITNIFEEIEE